VFAEVMEWPDLAATWDQPETLARIWAVAEQHVRSN